MRWLPPFILHGTHLLDARGAGAARRATIARLLEGLRDDAGSRRRIRRTHLHALGGH